MRKFIIIILIFQPYYILSQSIDRIEAVVGNEIILRSDIELQYLQYLSQGGINSEEIKCQVIEDLLFQKILINQAKLDSIDVSDDEVNQQVLSRINYFEQQLGSIKKIEEYFEKSISDIKLNLEEVIRDQIQAERMQSSLTENIQVTPTEVKDIYSSLDLEDIPLIPTQYEISQIVIEVKITEEQKKGIKDKLNKLRERVYNGEDFKVLAALYSDDIGSANNGGELGFVTRGNLVPEFERAAFSLNEGEISEVIESDYGFHIIQFVERRGEEINVRHILIKSKPNAANLQSAKLRIDSIFSDLKAEKISFEDAIKLSSRNDNKDNSGVLINKANMTSMYTLDDMSTNLKSSIEKLKVNEISTPTLIRSEVDNTTYKIFRLDKKIESHKANLIDDFTLLYELTKNIKKEKYIVEWINKVSKKTFIKLNQDINSCNFRINWNK